MQYMGSRATFEYGVVLGRAKLVRLAASSSTRLSVAMHISAAANVGATIAAEVHRGTCTAISLNRMVGTKSTLFANPYLCADVECTNDELAHARGAGLSPYFVVKMHRLDAAKQASSGDFEGTLFNFVRIRGGSGGWEETCKRSLFCVREVESRW